MSSPRVKLSARFSEMILRIVKIGVRGLVVAACVLGIWESWKILRCDEFSWQDTPSSLRAAIRLEPDSWWYYMQLARLDDGNAEKLLQSSLRANAYNSDATIELALRYEADGDFPRAEKLLLQAFSVDQTYAPRWSLANFYFRHDNFPAFWTWARRAAEMPANDISALFELCWRVSPEPKTIEANIVVNDPSVVRQYVDFLMSKDQIPAAVDPALRLIRSGSPKFDHERIFNLIYQVVAANDVDGADSLWHELIRQNWIVADAAIPNNPEFARDPLPVRFDWNIPADNGFHSWPGSSGLVTEFTGDEPENFTIAEQAIILAPGNYRLESSYHTHNIAADTGICWEITPIESDTAIASSPFLSSNTPANFNLPFSVDSDHRLLRLRLMYRRQLGTTRIAGTLVVPSIRIQALPKS
jgi:hypothetical protein